MKLIAVFNPPQPIVISANFGTLGAELGTPVVKEYVDTPTYTGDYEVTPSDEVQTLYTAGKRMTNDVTIHPIPSNYGRIEYNGAVLTVS